MANSLSTFSLGLAVGVAASTIVNSCHKTWLEKQSNKRELVSQYIKAIVPSTEFFRGYEQHCASNGLHYIDAFKRPHHAQDDMDKRAHQEMRSVSDFWEKVTEYSKYGLLPKDFFTEEWKERARQYMDVVQPLEKADYESSSFAAKYGGYHENDNRPQQFDYIEKL